MEEEEELFDLVIPPGVPRTIIRDILETFDVELVPHRSRLYFANMEGDERDLLAFRGKMEEVQRVEAFMFEEMKKFIN
ncbi:MAG: hypothetical protein D5R99_09315 [Methanocalculus sp. MSAO_Arc1]|uniref:hypothetical protein n=1 Tax=Methanocalculus TaxID=71151 RepID=UPI000FF35A34|nr:MULTISPECIES: hypothetical protein [unclassified Methanocalculus]MCP1662830.1 hypothetical protein [Methanocalculus sp. AMF5]RQD79006.1 MAG: hypothetical protein D5R99_09315 [Methanocalculus sp. MSAO_Arc1]